MKKFEHKVEYLTLEQFKEGYQEKSDSWELVSVLPTTVKAKFGDEHIVDLWIYYFKREICGYTISKEGQHVHSKL